MQEVDRADIPAEQILDHGTSGERTVLVGTLDVVLTRALPGEALIGQVKHAAYLANVCCSNAARRRGVAGQLITAARDAACSFGMPPYTVKYKTLQCQALGSSE